MKIRPLQIYLAASIAGLIALTLLAPAEEFVSIDEINKEHEEQQITTTGTIQKINFHEKNTFLTLKGNSHSIKGVIFNTTTQQMLELEAGKTITIRGKVETYRGEREIIVEEVENVV